MVVKIRMQRFGRIRRPFYKIVAVDARKARNAQPIEYLGSWDPLVDKNGSKKLRLSEDRIKYWLTVGAQPSDTVAKLLWRVNLLPKPPITYKPKRSVPKNEREFSTYIPRGNFDHKLPEMLPQFADASITVGMRCDENSTEVDKLMYIEPFASIMNYNGL